MWVYEANYRLLAQLVPELLDCDGALLLRGGKAGQSMHIRVDERCKYTTLLSVRMPFTVDGCHLPDLAMDLRVYHDAQAVEVKGYQGCQRIPPAYMVAGDSRHQKDEKRQINHLLYDLLRYCIAQNFSEYSLVDS